MAESLVIVESPAKAKTIGKFLGSHYRVVASNGHVRDLPKSQLSVDVNNHFEPKYITIRGRGEVLERIRKEAKNAKKVFLATDPDREGEAISWHLAQVLNMDPGSKCRIEFNEITATAVKNSIKNARAIDMRLVNAQQARRVLDRLVGYEISEVLWKKVRKGLSAGRVQSVAMRIICDREREIAAFEPEEYWQVTVQVLWRERQEVRAAYRAGYGSAACAHQGTALLRHRSQERGENAPCRAAVYDEQPAAGGGQKAQFYHQAHHDGCAAALRGRGIGRQRPGRPDFLYPNRFRARGKRGAAGSACLH